MEEINKISIDASNVYLFGSRLYGTHREDSDYDYIIVCNDEDYSRLKEKYYEVDYHIFTVDMFERKIENMDIVALE